MSGAQIVFEQYKVLPPQLKKEFKALVEEEESEMVEISVKHLKEGLRELKSVLNGKSKATPIKEFLKELRDEA